MGSALKRVRHWWNPLCAALLPIMGHEICILSFYAFWRKTRVFTIKLLVKSYLWILVSCVTSCAQCSVSTVSRRTGCALLRVSRSNKSYSRVFTFVKRQCSNFQFYCWNRFSSPNEPVLRKAGGCSLVLEIINYSLSTPAIIARGSFFCSISFP